MFEFSVLCVFKNIFWLGIPGYGKFFLNFLCCVFSKLFSDLEFILNSLKMKSTLWIWLLYNSVFWLLVVVIMLMIVWYFNFNKIVPPKYYTVSHILNISGVMRKYESVPPNPASHWPLGEQRNHHLWQDHTTGGQKKDGSGWWYSWYLLCE